jgi:hypothetical protein
MRFHKEEIETSQLTKQKVREVEMTPYGDQHESPNIDRGGGQNDHERDQMHGGPSVCSFLPTYPAYKNSFRRLINQDSVGALAHDLPLWGEAIDEAQHAGVRREFQQLAPASAVRRDRRRRGREDLSGLG